MPQPWKQFSIRNEQVTDNVRRLNAKKISEESTCMTALNEGYGNVQSPHQFCNHAEGL